MLTESQLKVLLLGATAIGTLTFIMLGRYVKAILSMAFFCFLLVILPISEVATVLSLASLSLMAVWVQFSLAPHLTTIWTFATFILLLEVCHLVKQVVDYAKFK